MFLQKLLQIIFESNNAETSHANRSFNAEITRKKDIQDHFRKGTNNKASMIYNYNCILYS